VLQDILSPVDGALPTLENAACLKVLGMPGPFFQYFLVINQVGRVLAKRQERSN